MKRIWLGTAGLKRTLSFGVGSTAAAVSGYLADLYGLRIVFGAMGFCFLISAAFVLMLVWIQNSPKPNIS